MKVLFVCTANRLRSPTAEAIFKDRPGFEVRSAGLDPHCPNPLSTDMINWAECIFVMEAQQREKIRKRYRKILGDRRVYTLGIPDEYEFMQPELVESLKERAGSFLD